MSVSLSVIHLFFRNHFILIRAVVDPETLGSEAGIHPCLDASPQTRIPFHQQLFKTVTGNQRTLRKPTLWQEEHAEFHTDGNPSSGSNRGPRSYEVAWLPITPPYNLDLYTRKNSATEPRTKTQACFVILLWCLLASALFWYRQSWQWLVKIC